jgi:hypothetical protein
MIDLFNPFVSYLMKYLYSLVCAIILNQYSYSQRHPIIVTNADHYSISLKNTTTFHIRVKLDRNGKYVLNTIVTPNQSNSVDKIFTKNIAKNTVVSYTYDNETFIRDKKASELNLENTLRTIDRRKVERENNIRQEFYSRVGAELAASVKTNSNDNFLIKIIKSLTRGGGKIAKTYYSYKDFYNKFVNKSYHNYTELLKDLAKNHIESKVVDELSNFVQSNLGTDKEVNKGVINAILFYVQELEELPQNLENEKLNARNSQREYLKLITSMKTSPTFNNDYTLFNELPEGTNFRTITPNFSLTIEPLVYGNDLNKYWEILPDKIFVTDPKTNSFSFGEGIGNSTFGGSLSFAISPEIILGENTFSKFYGNIGYSQYLYQLDSIPYRLSKTFFADIPNNSTGFSISNPIRFDQVNLVAGIDYKIFLGKIFTMGLSGGLIQQLGKLNLSSSELSQGYSWKVSEVEISDKTYIPYAGVQIGIGRNNFHRGTHLTLSGQVCKPQHVNITNYKIFDSLNNNIIDFDSENLNYKICIGLAFSF